MRYEGKAIQFVAPKDLNGGEYFYNESLGWGGVVAADTKAGEKVALNIAPDIYEFTGFVVKADTTLAVGDFVYYDKVNDQLINEDTGYIAAKVTELYSAADNSGGSENITVNGQAVLLAFLTAGI
jgi:hypothetical protein